MLCVLMFIFCLIGMLPEINSVRILPRIGFGSLLSLFCLVDVVS